MFTILAFSPILLIITLRRWSPNMYFQPSIPLLYNFFHLTFSYTFPVNFWHLQNKYVNMNILFIKSALFFVFLFYFFYFFDISLCTQIKNNKSSFILITVWSLMCLFFYHTMFLLFKGIESILLEFYLLNHWNSMPPIFSQFYFSNYHNHTDFHTISFIVLLSSKTPIKTPQTYFSI